MATEQTTRTRSWREDPTAAALLQECAAGYPSTREFRYAYGETERRYTGSIVARLNGIYRRHGEKLLSEADRSGDYSAFHAWAEDSVTKAIEDAIRTEVQQCAADLERIAA